VRTMRRIGLVLLLSMLLSASGVVMAADRVNTQSGPVYIGLDQQAEVRGNSRRQDSGGDLAVKWAGFIDRISSVAEQMTIALKSDPSVQSAKVILADADQGQDSDVFSQASRRTTHDTDDMEQVLGVATSIRTIEDSGSGGPLSGVQGANLYTLSTAEDKRSGGTPTDMKSGSYLIKAMQMSSSDGLRPVAAEFGGQVPQFHESFDPFPR